jgi:hypothetical protein
LTVALIDPSKNPDQAQRLPVPEEPGDWVEVRMATAGDLIAMNRDMPEATAGERMSLLLSRCILRWSYSDWPASTPRAKEQRENEARQALLESLDIDTFRWLEREVQLTRLAEEKKDSNGSSSPPTDPAKEASPASSVT